MGQRYVPVQWNGNKIVYDVVVATAVALFLGLFVAFGMKPNADGHAPHIVILLIKGLGAASFLMLTAILTIGPLARFSPRFLPILYNRRHFGVMTFIVAAAHFLLALFWYHGSGPLNPFVSLLVSNPQYQSVVGFPFEAFGLGAFAILLVLAATSHDYWLNNLSAPVWKALHMLVYAAFALVVLHVAWGALMTQKSSVYVAATAGAFVLVAGLHLAAGWREVARDNAMRGRSEWIDICAPGDIEDKRALIAPLPSGERVAVFRDGARIYAVSNVCRHQNGPLGEGCLKDGLVTCPWHGWQYDPETGISPPPYTEKIATYDARLTRGRVEVKAKPNPPGTRSNGATLSASEMEALR
ncbi:MAG: ferric reductase-like transmembrane domain-containing protein [Parvularculaceae bacterium]|nr:ferric reductase-like transmembrane domain-containing protein [Parvularculaceae bacterium]